MPCQTTKRDGGDPAARGSKQRMDEKSDYNQSVARIGFAAPTVHIARHYRSTRAFIEGSFSKLRRVLPKGAQLPTEHLTAKDAEAVVELHSLATPTNGMLFDNRYCVRYFHDGVIVRVRAYLDSAMGARLFEENPIA
jgi:ketosteroid isomerase-like protein